MQSCQVGFWFSYGLILPAIENHIAHEVYLKNQIPIDQFYVCIGCYFMSAFVLSCLPHKDSLTSSFTGTSRCTFSKAEFRFECNVILWLYAPKDTNYRITHCSWSLPITQGAYGYSLCLRWYGISGRVGISWIFIESGRSTWTSFGATYLLRIGVLIW